MANFKYSPDQDLKEDVHIYRTMMPDAGPSAFAVFYPNIDLAFCYDPVRGGVNYIWFGQINLKPTVAGKINDLAIVEGEPFYRETKWHPLRTTANGEDKAEYHFQGYNVLDGVLEFSYTIDGGVKVSERITPIKDRGIHRNFEVEFTNKFIEPLYLLMEPQDQAEIAVVGGIIQNEKWAVFNGKPLKQFAVTIMKVGEAEL